MYICWPQIKFTYVYIYYVPFTLGIQGVSIIIASHDLVTHLKISNQWDLIPGHKQLNPLTIQLQIVQSECREIYRDQ